MSTISVPTTRQFPIAAVATFTYEDVVGAVAVALFGVQVGSIITSIDLVINVSFAGGTTHDANFGDATDPNEYSATICELDGTAGVPPTNRPATSGFLTTSSEPSVLMTPTSTGGDPTSGSATVFATYLVSGRAHENYEL